MAITSRACAETLIFLNSKKCSMSSNIISCLKLFDFMAFLRLGGQFRYRNCLNLFIKLYIFTKLLEKKTKRSQVYYMHVLMYLPIKSTQ